MLRKSLIKTAEILIKIAGTPVHPERSHPVLTKIAEIIQQNILAEDIRENMQSLEPDAPVEERFRLADEATAIQARTDALTAELYKIIEEPSTSYSFEDQSF